MTYRIETHNLDGRGDRPTRVYDLPPVKPNSYWDGVTDVACPVCHDGLLRWAEAGYVAGYRICDGCGRHFLASGDAERPVVLRVGKRRTSR